MKPTQDGLDRVGFIKQREIYDGCVLTTEKEAERAKIKEDGGELHELVLKPTSGQLIIGEVKPLYVLEEMPTLGVNIVPAVGGGLGGLNAGIDFEYNIANKKKKGNISSKMNVMLMLVYS